MGKQGQICSFWWTWFYVTVFFIPSFGIGNLSLDEVKNFRQFGSLTPGHPEYGHTVGVEATTGP